MGILMRLPILLLLSILPYKVSHAADTLQIIAHAEADTLTLTKSQVKELYMSGSASFDNIDGTLTAVTIPPGKRARLIFNARIIGLPESRIQSYWAQMQFSGRTSRPIEVEDKTALLNYVQDNRGAVGYVIKGTPLPSNVDVVYTID